MILLIFYLVKVRVHYIVQSGRHRNNAILIGVEKCVNCTMGYKECEVAKDMCLTRIDLYLLPT